MRLSVASSRLEIVHETSRALNSWIASILDISVAACYDYDDDDHDV